jgi:hypothetical protein
MAWENELEDDGLSALPRLFLGVLVIAAESKSFSPPRSNWRSKHSASRWFVMYPRED